MNNTKAFVKISVYPLCGSEMSASEKREAYVSAKKIEHIIRWSADKFFEIAYADMNAEIDMKTLTGRSRPLYPDYASIVLFVHG